MVVKATSPNHVSSSSKQLGCLLEVQHTTASVDADLQLHAQLVTSLASKIEAASQHAKLLQVCRACMTSRLSGLVIYCSCCLLWSVLAPVLT